MKTNKLISRIYDNPERAKKIVFKILLIGSILAAIKMIFQNYSLDEEYQVVMAFRNIKGDHLFVQMWEPHQTSAFLCYIFTKIFMLITGSTTGLVIFLRFCGSLIHLGIAVYGYKVLSRFLNKDFSYLLALIFFNTIPKLIQLPEFGMMQVWFYMLMFLFLVAYHLGENPDKKGKKRYLFLMGIAMALEVLSYPTAIILFPFMLIAIGILSKDKKLRDMGIFAGTCAVSGLLYCLKIIQNISVHHLMRNLHNIYKSDATHGYGKKFQDIGLFHGLTTLTIYCLAIFSVAGLVYFLWNRLMKKENSTDRPRMVIGIGSIAIVISCLVQIWHWVVLNSGYENLQIQIVVTTIVGLVALKYVDSPYKKVVKILIIGSIVALISVLMVTDLALLRSIPHGFGGAFFGLTAIIMAMESKSYPFKKRVAYLLLFAWCLTAIFGKGYTLRDGGDYNNIFQSRGLLKHGPAIGTVSDYMGAYIYNSEYETWQKEIADGSNVLVVTYSYFSASTTQYMFKDVNICNYSTIDPTIYDRNLLKYWREYPEKEPDTIVIDCWFGNLLCKDDQWIMKYINKDFGYTQVYDGSYIRIYKKDQVQKNHQKNQKTDKPSVNREKSNGKR